MPPGRPVTLSEAKGPPKDLSRRLTPGRMRNVREGIPRGVQHDVIPVDAAFTPICVLRGESHSTTAGNPPSGVAGSDLRSSSAFSSGSVSLMNTPAWASEPARYFSLSFVRSGGVNSMWNR